MTGRFCRVALLPVLLLGGACAQAVDFEDPIRIQADGKDIDVDGGHAAPYFADWDGDGKRDLLVGQFAGGELRIYKNVGTDKSPRFTKFELFQAGGDLGTVPSGFGPQLVDVTGDGLPDVISGSSQGRLYLFARHRSGGYGRRKLLKEPRGFGEATAVHAADWDDDGDLDLIVGDKIGYVYLVPNEGTAERGDFRRPVKISAETASGDDLEIIRAPGGHSAPFVADWDSDGKGDLVLGCGGGSIEWFRNVGEKGKPRLEAPRMLIEPGKTGMGGPFRRFRKNPHGMYVKIQVTDWNGDGVHDLLVGDYPGGTGLIGRLLRDSAGDKRVFHGFVWLFLGKRG